MERRAGSVEQRRELRIVLVGDIVVVFNGTILDACQQRPYVRYLGCHQWHSLGPNLKLMM